MDFSEHDRLTEEGYLRKVVSPCGKLMLYNYTDKCTFEKHWNKTTLSSRGTVYEIETGKLIAKAFPKFFNFGELDEKAQNIILKSKRFEAFEKLDGSLGVVYFYDGKWRVNTRGSFTSEQAVRATKILENYAMHNINPRFTLLVEIIYPENKIILDYGDREELVLLGAMCGKDVEATYEQLKNMHMVGGFPLAKKYDFSSIDELIEKKSTLDATDEGFVVRMNNGYRCKFKSAEYLKLARIMSNMTPLNFWRNMNNGVVSKEMLESIPEEFRSDSDKEVYRLEDNYNRIYKEIEDDYRHVTIYVSDLHDIEKSRKNLGLWLKDHGDQLKHQSAIFPLFLSSKKGVETYIMKKIRPKGNEL